MKTDELLAYYSRQPVVAELSDLLAAMPAGEIAGLSGLAGSAPAVIAASVISGMKGAHIFVMNDKEQAAYFLNDLESLLDDMDAGFQRKKVLFFPSSYRHAHDFNRADSANALERSRVVGKLASSAGMKVVVTYPEALAEKLLATSFISRNTFHVNSGGVLEMDEIIDFLDDHRFERVDFVVAPGQYAVRGGIFDVFSYSDDHPYRIEFRGNDVASLRSFDPGNQLSVNTLDRITIIPDINDRRIMHKRSEFQLLLPQDAIIWLEDMAFTADRISSEQQKAATAAGNDDEEANWQDPEGLFQDGDAWLAGLSAFRVVEMKRHPEDGSRRVVMADMLAQPSFNKNFDLLAEKLKSQHESGYKNLILSSNPKQLERLYSIFEDMAARKGDAAPPAFDTMNISLHEGFIDRQSRLACFTDHQVFERYHKFRLREGFGTKETLSIAEISELKQGDYVTHIDHGVGRFDGLEKIVSNGREQEAIRLVYKNNDLLYVSIHSLHRIAKYTGPEGSVPQLNKLGSNAWNKLKNKTRQKVKDIARDLIKLYAERKAASGFAFSPDSYLQTELEASFIYEDTPDQLKATLDVKRDMEADNPMDRLICGDVGFGKTEVAIRAAFKTVADSRQVALLVPTTILALQHYKTFSERLAEFPCTVDYISRFKSAARQKETIRKLAAGEIDILIGTHRLIGKDIRFSNLGLLIIDEEQKFGVSAKEKLKRLRVNVDTLTLTATPIPRTLQFSMMGARDLSVINTPPPNRYPVHTQLCAFSEEMIRDAIEYELSRGGQIFFVHNRVQNILDVEYMLQRFVPGARIAVAHGQMEGRELETRMAGFIEGEYDILLATTIIESGLDIPNVNTIIINDAHHFGLSDLHQLRGRVGRANRKAFCYLLTPPLSGLTTEARQRLKAIGEFAGLGSGFNIAMRDLDIRGAGNLLGAEQSGFISEIGFEMYHRILDDAIRELKEKEFRELFAKEEDAAYVGDCQIETDLELLIPDEYVSSIRERLSLYKELDNIKTEEGLMGFQDILIDRFGPLPDKVSGLMNALRLRWLGGNAGFEKLVMRNGSLTAHFVSSQDSVYYNSDTFRNILAFIQAHPAICRIKETPGRLSLSVRGVRTVYDALVLLRQLLQEGEN